jgi:UDP-N-acetylmuramate--alanine ligase
VYFIGIGGIGMSALARWFRTNGYPVAGYDRTPTLLTNQLAAEGIAVHYDDSVALIPEEFRQRPEATLVVFTPAVPKDHRELNYFLERGYVVRKRSQVLGWLTQNQYTIAVAGTHGKTTTSSMIAHILRASGKNCTAFLGGITQNYETNLLLNDPDSPEEPVVVVEADEYDRSFLTLSPDVAVINSVDPDHLDIYGSAGAVLESYNAFVGKIKPGGKLIIKKDLPLNAPADTTVRTVDFSLAGPAHLVATHIRIEQASFLFDVESPDILLKDVRLNVPGFHNVENALAAIAAAIQLKITPEAIKMAVASYKGVKRRFEYILKSDYLVYIDDYAHHPAEIEALLKSVRALYPGRKISAVFQPHLYSRTRDFADGFASSLSLADQLFLLDIYPARELPIDGVSAQLIFDRVTIPNKVLCTKNNLLEQLNNSRIEVLVTLGAGDIDQCVSPIKEHFLSRNAR